MQASIPGDDGKDTLRPVEQRKESQQVDPAAGDRQVVAHQRVLHAGRAGRQLQEHRFRQRQRGIGVGRRRRPVVVQHRVGYVQHVRLAGVGQHQVDFQLHALGPRTVQRAGHRLEKTFDRREGQHVQQQRRRNAGVGRAVAQLVGAGQVEVAPGRRLGGPAELVLSSREQLFRIGVARRSQHHVTEQLGGPTQVALVERRLRRGHRLGVAAGQRDVAARRFARRQRVEIGRVGVEPAKVELVDRLGVVAQRAVVAVRVQERVQRLR